MAKAEKSGIIVGMPAYNEEKYVGSVVLQARQFADEVVVVDDGSSDRTAEVARLPAPRLSTTRRTVAMVPPYRRCLPRRRKEPRRCWCCLTPTASTTRKK